MYQTIKNKMDVASIAHRGYAVKEIENTLGSFLEAGKRDFFGIETDIYFTKDGYIICNHDPIIKGMDKNINDSTFEEINKINLSKEKIVHAPLFSDYLKICRDYHKIPVIEFKTLLEDKQIEEVISFVKKYYGDINKCFFISFHRSPLKKMQDIANKEHYSYQILRLGQTKEVALEALIDNMGINYEFNSLEQDIVNKFKAKHLPVAVWTVDSYIDVKRMISMGVEYITSNHIKCKKKYCHF